MAIERINILGELKENERLHITRYEWASMFTRGKDVIDASCGCGYGAQILGAKKYRGYDIDKPTISYAKYNYGKYGDFFVKDLTKDKLPKCDVLVSFETIEHLDDYEFFLRNINADLILISAPIMIDIESHKHVWNIPQIKAIFDKYFKYQYFIQHLYKGRHLRRSNLVAKCIKK
jgi:2-polyprenyl-3-methyl-5-hydroxy-6-metoxy-1,4-benzoquinol methylase